MTCPCGNPARPQRTKCRTCETRAWRQRHPVHYAFDTLRSHARGRGIAFCLSLVEFAAFCEATGYCEARGRDATSLTVDRKDHRGGYELGNIQALTHAHNSRKGWFERHGLAMGDADEEEAP